MERQICCILVWDCGRIPRELADGWWLSLSAAVLDPEVNVGRQSDDLIEGPRQGVRHQLVLNVVGEAVQEGITEGTFAPAVVMSPSPKLTDLLKFRSTPASFKWAPWARTIQSLAAQTRSKQGLSSPTRNSRLVVHSLALPVYWFTVKANLVSAVARAVGRKKLKKFVKNLLERGCIPQGNPHIIQPHVQGSDRWLWVEGEDTTGAISSMPPFHCLSFGLSHLHH